eukprot:TRINITY_DN9453_c0_g1_i1.p1 TRINITY_DN9453_c0_g1~~TRINITY_DN9453_c0_g1_i1.p1  ORF type:complete len:244 (+),score=141.20 TRINITY_DN9453_c0_g1_i1:106-732(+)
MERKNAKDASKAQAQAQAAEDALWADDDKKGKKKASKASQDAEKAREKAARKAERDAIEREEDAAMANKRPAKKMTKAEIDAQVAKSNKAKPQKSDVVSEQQQAKLLSQSNNNKSDTVEASGLKDASEAVSRMNIATDVAEDQHPEKRLKAAHMAFEEKMMPILKADNPGLKRSQLKEMCFKQWQKSPENPMVQQAMKMHKLQQAQQQ